MEELNTQSAWAKKRAAGKARRAARIERREVYFDLLVSGYSVAQIALKLKMSPSAVRRAIGQALAERRLDAPEDFARLQFARLMKALRCADISLEQGEVTAIAPYLGAMAELNRFYGLAAGPLQLARPAAARKGLPGAAPPLALAHPPGLAVETDPAPIGSRAKEVDKWTDLYT
jgi:hypothetical protein